MSNYIVVHRKDTNNVGDMAADPLQYFLKPDQYTSIDINDWWNLTPPEGSKIIVGGGGLLVNENFEAIMEIISSSDRRQLNSMLKKSWVLSDNRNSDAHKDFTNKFTELLRDTIKSLKDSKSKKYIWGAGHNGELKKKSSFLEYPDYLMNFDLVGVRDYGQRFNWVPCASCMAPALQKKYPIKNDVIWFEHKKQLVKDFGDVSAPRFINSGNNLDQTIELLGSANIIVTNSYHGAYWGTLLKKRVIVVEPWSSKFMAFKHKPYMLNKGESISDAIEKTKSYDNALEECINATEAFWKRVQE